MKRTSRTRTAEGACALTEAQDIGEPSPRETTKRVRYLGPHPKPFRMTMQYNNLMYAVAREVLETVAGMHCGQVLKKWLWGAPGYDDHILAPQGRH